MVKVYMQYEAQSTGYNNQFYKHTSLPLHLHIHKPRLYIAVIALHMTCLTPRG